MDEKILTKEEYTEKLNNLIKPVIEFAMSTKQFNDQGCYSEEFVKVGDKEVTLMVMDKGWVSIPLSEWNIMRDYRSLYLNLNKEQNDLKARMTRRERRKFFWNKV